MESRLEKLYDAAEMLGGELKGPVIKDYFSDDYSTAFAGEFNEKGLNYSDSFELSMKRGINKEWWNDIILGTN